MSYITFNYHHALEFFNEKDIFRFKDRIEIGHHTLHDENQALDQYLGWLHLPQTYDINEFNEIKKCAEKVQNDTDVLLVIGVGGSYLGARAAIHMLTHTFQNLLSKDERKVPQILFVGHHLSSTYIQDLFDVLDDKDVSINVVSKSGTTLEPALAFRIFKQYLEKRYGKTEARQRIFVTTDKEKGALNKIANQEGYQTFVIPDNVGGRYSVLTAVGLLPMAISGISIDDVMRGAKEAMLDLANPDLEVNPAYQYAVIRQLLYEKEKTTELLVSYEPQLQYFSEWWKQLFGESEGKNKTGIFPAAVSYTTDLHSLGQYIQDGRRDIFQTVLHVNEPNKKIQLESCTNNYDHLNYLAGEYLHTINDKAYQGALLAHTKGGVPNLVINIPKLNAHSFGYLVYFFEKACAVSGLLLDVNPFDQPGVEAYKQNMFELLNKPHIK